MYFLMVVILTWISNLKQNMEFYLHQQIGHIQLKKLWARWYHERADWIWIKLEGCSVIKLEYPTSSYCSIYKDWHTGWERLLSSTISHHHSSVFRLTRLALSRYFWDHLFRQEMGFSDSYWHSWSGLFAVLQ